MLREAEWGGSSGSELWHFLCEQPACMVTVPATPRAFSQYLNADRSLVIKGVAILALPVGAGLGDAFGRKPMLVFSHMMSLKSIFFNMLASLPFFIHGDPNAYILYLSGLLSGLSSGSGPVSMGMLVDIIPEDMREQGFPVMGAFATIGPGLAFALGYYLLHKHLHSYTTFWIAML